jgi:hypothetical protein
MTSDIMTKMNVLKAGVITALIAGILFSGGFAFAQSEDEQALRDTIRAAILSDPRSKTMTDAEVGTMVLALTRQAQSVGMTAEDIVWRPTEAAPAGSESTCDGLLCSLNHAFGFDGSDYTIPIWLGASALMLIFLIAGILELRHVHRKRLAQRPPIQQ